MKSPRALTSQERRQGFRVNCIERTSNATESSDTGSYISSTRSKTLVNRAMQSRFDPLKLKPNRHVIGKELRQNRKGGLNVQVQEGEVETEGSGNSSSSPQFSLNPMLAHKNQPSSYPHGCLFSSSSGYYMASSPHHQPPVGWNPQQQQQGTMLMMTHATSQQLFMDQQLINQKQQQIIQQQQKLQQRQQEQLRKQQELLLNPQPHFGSWEGNEGKTSPSLIKSDSSASDEVHTEQSINIFKNRKSNAFIDQTEQPTRGSVVAENRDTIDSSCADRDDAAGVSFACKTLPRGGRRERRHDDGSFVLDFNDVCKTAIEDTPSYHHGTEL
jgi:hypothetical protein